MQRYVHIILIIIYKFLFLIRSRSGLYFITVIDKSTEHQSS